MSPPCTGRSRGLGTVTGWPTDSPGPHPCCAVPSSNGNARTGSLGRFVLCVFVLWTSATRPPNRVTAHRHHDVTHASISLGSSQRNQPLGRLNDRHHRGQRSLGPLEDEGLDVAVGRWTQRHARRRPRRPRLLTRLTSVRPSEFATLSNWSIALWPFAYASSNQLPEVGGAVHRRTASSRKPDRIGRRRWWPLIASRLRAR